MRILQMGPYPPPHGGVQTNLVAIRQFLLKSGIPCAAINLTRFRRYDAEGVYYPKNALHVLWLLGRLRYNIIHLHIGGNLTPRLLGLSLLCCLMPRSKTVLTFHSGGYPSSSDGRTARPWSLRGFIFRRFDRIIGVNQEIVDLFRRFGVSLDRVRLISPYAPTSHPPNVPTPEELQGFLACHKPVLLTVGLLEPEYDLSLQIAVLGVVRERFPNAGLVIIGSGNLEEKLRKEIRGTHYSEDIMLCGDVAHPVTLRVIAESDLFLRTSLYDGDSIAVREALQLGKPVIASDNGQRPAGVYLIPPSNLTALHRAIEDCLTRPAPHQTNGTSDDHNLQAVLQLYREIAPINS